MTDELLDAVEGDSSRAASPEQFSALTWAEVRPLLAAARRLQAAEKAWAQFSHRHGEAREHTYGCESRHNKAAGAPCTCGLSALAAALERAP